MPEGACAIMRQLERTLIFGEGTDAQRKAFDAVTCHARIFGKRPDVPVRSGS